MTRALSRRQARRQALILLFQSDLTGRPLGELYEGDIDEYARETAQGVLAAAAALDAEILRDAYAVAATPDGPVPLPLRADSG